MLRREYSDYEVPGLNLPWYWGMSYQKILLARVVFHVIPFNFLVRWSRDFLFWVRTAGNRGYRHRIENHIFQHAFKNGQENIRSRLFCKVNNDLIAQGIPPENAGALARHILKAHMGI